MSLMSFWRNLFGRHRSETITDDDSRSRTQATPAERQDEAEDDPPPAAAAKAEDKLDTPLAEDQIHDRTEEKSEGPAPGIVFAPPPAPPQKSSTEDG